MLVAKSVVVLAEIITRLGDEDKYLSLVARRQVAVIGYGNQGRSQALNMRDSGLRVVVGNPHDPYEKLALEDGFKVVGVSEASGLADIVFILIPDEVQPEVFERSIKPHLRENSVVVMASGYNYFYGYVKPPDYADVLLLAPRMIGWAVRELYTRGEGFPALVAVGHDHSGVAKGVMLGLAAAMGVFKRGGCAVVSSFREETLLDLLSEQTWAGALLFMFRAYYEVATELGASPEAAILELYASGELAEIAESMKNLGLFEQLRTHSRTSQYGQLTRGPGFVGEEVKDKIRGIALNILNGSFAREWALEQRTGMTVFNRLHEINREHPMELEEKKLYKILGRIG